MEEMEVEILDMEPELEVQEEPVCSQGLWTEPENLIYRYSGRSPLQQLTPRRLSPIRPLSDSRFGNPIRRNAENGLPLAAAGAESTSSTLNQRCDRTGTSASFRPRGLNTYWFQDFSDPEMAFKKLTKAEYDALGGNGLPLAAAGAESTSSASNQGCNRTGTSASFRTRGVITYWFQDFSDPEMAFKKLTKAEYDALGENGQGLNKNDESYGDLHEDHIDTDVSTDSEEESDDPSEVSEDHIDTDVSTDSEEESDDPSEVSEDHIDTVSTDSEEEEESDDPSEVSEDHIDTDVSTDSEEESDDPSEVSVEPMEIDRGLERSGELDEVESPHIKEVIPPPDDRESLEPNNSQDQECAAVVEEQYSSSFNWTWTKALLLPEDSQGSVDSGISLSLEKINLAAKRCKINPAYPSKACQLSTEDDIASALVIDPFIGFKTHKMNPAYKPPGPRENQQLCRIVTEFIENQDYSLAYQSLVEGGWLQDCPDGDSMKAHVIRYLHVYDKNAGFRVDPCDRYMEDGYKGVKISASRMWSKGQKINLMVGCIAELNDVDEERLILEEKNDFSIMYSCMKKCSQLWLGPGSYINHDCRPNCRFESTGKSTACIIVIKDIEKDEELTVSYGTNFFEEGNKKCGCCSCESEGKGAFVGKENGGGGDGDGEKGTGYKLRITKERAKNRRVLGAKGL